MEPLLPEPTPEQPVETPAEKPTHHKWKLRLTRDAVLFIVGIVIILHETFIQETVRVELLVIAAGFLGSPFVLRRNGF